MYGRTRGSWRRLLTARPLAALMFTGCSALVPSLCRRVPHPVHEHDDEPVGDVPSTWPVVSAGRVLEVEARRRPQPQQPEVTIYLVSANLYLSRVIARGVRSS